MDIVKPVLRGKHYNFVCGYMMFYRCVHGLDAYDMEGYAPSLTPLQKVGRLASLTLKVKVL
jgi:hypothetical protein